MQIVWIIFFSIFHCSKILRMHTMISYLVYSQFVCIFILATINGYILNVDIISQCEKRYFRKLFQLILYDWDVHTSNHGTLIWLRRLSECHSKQSLTQLHTHRKTGDNKYMTIETQNNQSIITFARVDFVISINSRERKNGFNPRKFFIAK